MTPKQTSFKAGDRVVRLRKSGDRRNYWASGVVVMEIPAGVSPYAMYLRWFKHKGVCKMKDAQEPMLHKERYIVEVERERRLYYYCPCVNTIEKV